MRGSEPGHRALAAIKRPRGRRCCAWVPVTVDIRGRVPTQSLTLLRAANRLLTLKKFVRDANKSASFLTSVLTLMNFRLATVVRKLNNTLSRKSRKTYENQ